MTRNKDGLGVDIDALLPQTQCRACGYPNCRAYANAVASGTADINQCPPGGDETAAALANLLDVRVKPLDPRYGAARPPTVAIIDEVRCIGCTLCIEACPVDAIVGAAKLMHTILANACTGCELCLPPCPVDCITMQVIKPLNRVEQRAMATRARLRFDRREARRQSKPIREPAVARTDAFGSAVNKELVQRAMERARERLAEHKPANEQNAAASDTSPKEPRA